MSTGQSMLDSQVIAQYPMNSSAPECGKPQSLGSAPVEQSSYGCGGECESVSAQPAGCRPTTTGGTGCPMVSTVPRLHTRSARRPTHLRTGSTSRQSETGGAAGTPWDPCLMPRLAGRSPCLDHRPDGNERSARSIEQRIRHHGAALTPTPR